jgi:hypothetical protein
MQVCSLEQNPFIEFMKLLIAALLYSEQWCHPFCSTQFCMKGTLCTGRNCSMFILWNHHEMLWLIKTDKQNTQVYSATQRKHAAHLRETCELPRNTWLIFARLNDVCICKEESIHGTLRNTLHCLVRISGVPVAAVTTESLILVSNRCCTTSCTVAGNMWTTKLTYQPARLLYLCVLTL